MKALPSHHVQNVAQSHADSSSESSAKATTRVSIEIKNKNVTNLNNLLEYFDDDIDDLGDKADQQLIRKELRKLSKPLAYLQQVESADEAKESPAFDRLKKFVDKLHDRSTKLGQIVEKLENGVETVQKIGNFYNGIAEWCGMPVVPRTLLGQQCE